jgi:hypothetical protein
MNQLPQDVADQLRSLNLERSLRDACDALLRWQVGVETHADDYWSEQTGWIKRPSFAWMCGGFPGDWVQGGVHDEGNTAWRYMGVGPIWHTGQAMKALIMAREVAASVSERNGGPLADARGYERIDRAVTQGAAYLLRLQVLQGRHRGAFWCPPHSLPREWLAQNPSLTVYMSPGKWLTPKDFILNSDMSEAMEGFIMASELLQDKAITEACHVWGEWLIREANYKPGHYYHWFYADGTAKELVRYWQPDDGVAGLLAVKFNNAEWLRRYQEGVKRCIEWPIDLKEYPAQQARSFYWNSSVIWPVIDGRVPGDRERAVKKLAEYTNWLLDLAEPDGMLGFKYAEDKGGIPDSLNTSGDGAGTMMCARMCYQLWKNTGERRWCAAVVPLFRWMVNAQLRGPGAEGVEGAVSFCRWMRDPATGRKFGFKRSISTIFAIMALSEWVQELRLTDH